MHAGRPRRSNQTWGEYWDEYWDEYWLGMHELADGTASLIADLWAGRIPISVRKKHD